MIHRRMMMQKQEDAEMSEWVVLEDTTLETAQKWDKTYDNSYSRYLAKIFIPSKNDKIDTTTTVVLGSYALYYRTIATSSTYNQEMYVDVEKINNTQLLVKDCYLSQISGIAYAPNQRIAIIEVNNWIPQIRTAFELPAGSKIQVWAK